LKQINLPRRRAWRWLRTQSDVRQNPLDHLGLFNDRDNLQPAAAHTALNANVEHAL
jgi:hypothetical protein